MNYAIRFNDAEFYLSFITERFPDGLFRDVKFAKKYDTEFDAYKDIIRLEKVGCNPSDLKVVSMESPID